MPCGTSSQAFWLACAATAFRFTAYTLVVSTKRCGTTGRHRPWGIA